MNAAAGAYLHLPGTAELRWLGETSTFFLADGERTGEAFALVDERAAPGSFAHVPAGEVHGFRVASEVARYLILTTPRHGRFYRAITVPGQPDGQPPQDPVDGGTIRAAAAEYGIELVGPLPA